MLMISAEQHPAALTETWLHTLATRTNAWWYATGGHAPDLVHFSDLACYLANWSADRYGSPLVTSTYLHAFADCLAATFLEHRAELEAEARRWVLERANDRRLAAMTAGGTA